MKYALLVYELPSLVFSDYISVYTVERSVEDGSTVPIYYENRRVPIEIEDESLLEEIEEVLEGEEDDARTKLVTAGRSSRRWSVPRIGWTRWPTT
jgi:type I site-specific restriction-modification system R (restriction) subunit